MRTFDGYGRVSRRGSRTGPAYISPSVQRDGVQRWADYHGVTLDRWHFDEDKTGRNQNRPGMREAVRRVEAGEVDGIVCLKLNRFARNVVAALADFQRIQSAGGEIVFVEEQIDTSGPTGRLMLTLLLAMAEWEHENLTASFQIAKVRAVERGAYISRTPFGYQRQPDGTLAPHPEQAPIVAEAFRLAAGDNIQAAGAYLRRAVPHRRWTTTTVRRMLSARSYLGETRNGDLLQLDTHEPLVHRAIWEAAQTSPAHRRPAESFPLSGIARCATCKTSMIGSRGGKGQRTYRCAGRCARGAVITASILEGFAQDVARTALEGIRAHVSDPDADTLVLLERAVQDAEAELDAFAADMTARRLLGERYHDHMASRSAAVDRARDAYRQAARAAQESLSLRNSDLADDPTLWPMLLRRMLVLEVSPGRGMRVEDRVRVVPLDDDGTTGVAEP